MEIKYPNWLPKIYGSPQTSDEMNGIVEVLQNHAENLSLHNIKILAAASGIYTDKLIPTSSVPIDIGDKVFLITVPGTYSNFGGVKLPANHFGFIFKSGNSFSLQSVEIQMQDLTPLENRTKALENRNGGEVRFGETKNVSGDKVFDYVNNESITKFNHEAFPLGYYEGVIVIYGNKLWKSLTSANKETPSETALNWIEIKMSADVDQEFDESSKNPIANDVVTKRTSLLERLEDEATEVIEGDVIDDFNFSDFNTRFSVFRKGKGRLRANNTYISGNQSTIVYQNIPIAENTKITISLPNQNQTKEGNVYFSARNKQTLNWITIIEELVSTGSNIATKTIDSSIYDMFSVMSYDNSSAFNYISQATDGAVITKLDKDYLYNKLNQSGSYANPIGELVDIATISLPSGYTTFYYPWIITTENIKNPKGKYYLYFSTDHAGNAGKIGMFYSDNLVDWTFHGTVIQASTFGWTNAECETPTVLWMDGVKKFYCYFQTNPSRGGMGYSQATQIAESVDGVTWTWVKEAFNITMNKMKGDGHNGYFVCQKINGIYKGVSLFGGTDVDFRGVHFSKDGLNWITHQKETQGVNTTSYFWRQNALCRIATADVAKENEAGGIAGSYRKFALTYFDENLEILGGGDIIGNILQSGEPQVVSSMATNIIDGQIYLSAVYSKTKIVIKKLN